MASRLGHLPSAVFAGTSLVVILSSVFQGAAAPIATAFGFGGFIALYSLAAYGAIVIRHALFVKLYKKQALGVALIAIGFALSLISNILFSPFLPPNSSGSFGTPIGLPFIDFTWLVLLYWIDAGIRAARRSDPLLRDTLYWSKTRIVVWIITLGSAIVVTANAVYLVAATGLSVFEQPNVSPILDLVFLLLIFLPVLFGAIYLPMVAFRSKDPTLRGHLRWFGFFVVTFLAADAIFQVNVLASSPLPFLTLNLAAYFLYRSARSLVPLNRITSDRDS